MKLEHKFVVPAPVEEAWAAFNDLERVVPCFPGATLTSYDGDEFTGACKVKLGPVSLQYAGSGTFVERSAADHRALIEAKGKDRRGNSTASVRVTAQLAASGDSATDVTVETDLTITGRPAQFGRGLIQDVSDHLLAQFVTCLTTTLTPESPPVAGEPAGPTEPAGSTAPPAGSTAPTAPAAPTSPTAPTAPPPRQQAEAPSSGEPSAGASALDLGSALLPALARRARPYLIGAAAALLLQLVLRRLFRR
ncbi:SRPBCC family protein [Kribbella sp. NPDC050124]|uniref:SRPBCC family protein n=1 Tax=Kribbella sp. NPDC050124 TaxID=3364114 RepID=UPI0037879D45